MNIGFKINGDSINNDKPIITQNDTSITYHVNSTQMLNCVDKSSKKNTVKIPGDFEISKVREGDICFTISTLPDSKNPVSTFNALEIPPGYDSNDITNNMRALGISLNTAMGVDPKHVVNITKTGNVKIYNNSGESIPANTVLEICCPPFDKNFNFNEETIKKLKSAYLLDQKKTRIPAMIRIRNEESIKNMYKYFYIKAKNYIDMDRNNNNIFFPLINDDDWKKDMERKKIRNFVMVEVLTLLKYITILKTAGKIYFHGTEQSKLIHNKKLQIADLVIENATTNAAKINVLKNEINDLKNKKKEYSLFDTVKTNDYSDMKDIKIFAKSLGLSNEKKSGESMVNQIDFNFYDLLMDSMYTAPNSKYYKEFLNMLTLNSKKNDDTKSWKEGVNYMKSLLEEKNNFFIKIFNDINSRVIGTSLNAAENGEFVEIMLAQQFIN